MSEGAERRGNGQFVRGQSGNPEGARTRRRKELINSEDIARTILRVAGSRTQMAIAGKTQDISLLEANVWGLASGKPSNRLASKDFVELTKNAGYFMERLAREEQRLAREEKLRERGY